MSVSQYERNKQTGFGGGNIDTNGMHHQQKQATDKAVNDGKNEAASKK